MSAGPHSRSRPRPRDEPGGDPALPPPDANLLGATLLVMGGPFAWALLGAGAYMAQAPLCALGGPAPGPLLWALSALALGLAVLVLVATRPLARLLLAPGAAPATAGFLIAVARALAALSTLGILWLILAILILPDCPQLR